MAVISWGIPKIWIKDIENNSATWELLPTPVEDSTQLETTKGDKVEAKVEGGENEDVRVKRSTYALMLNIRKSKYRFPPVPSVDGVVEHHYAVMLQPEDAACPGFSIDKATVSVVDSYNAADGAMWELQFDALKPASGATVKWGVVTESGGTPTIVEGGVCAAPKFNPETWASGSTLTVYLSCDTEGASIYYTDDGETAPTSSSTAYTSAGIALSATKTIKAIAIKGTKSSDVVTKTFTKPGS